MGTSGTFYEDPGGDYFTRLNPERARTRAIRQLESPGYAVTLADTSASWTPATQPGLTPHAQTSPDLGESSRQRLLRGELRRHRRA